MSEQEAWTMVDKISKLIEERDALIVERNAANAEADKWCDRADQAEMHQRAAEAALARLREALRDFADHGTRFDCNPTVMVHNTPEWIASQEWWQNRATEMDVSVRNRARAALAPSATGISQGSMMDAKGEMGGYQG